jgi:hypothetical protein
MRGSRALEVNRKFQVTSFVPRSRQASTEGPWTRERERAFEEVEAAVPKKYRSAVKERSAE